MTKHSITWVGPPCEGRELEQVLAELADLEEGGLEPSDLWFHTVILTGDMDGPCVTVVAAKDGAGYEAKRHESAEWISLDDAIHAVSPAP